MSWLNGVTFSRATHRSGGSPRFRGRSSRRSLGAAGVAVATIAVFVPPVPLAGAASAGTFKFYTPTVVPSTIVKSPNQTQITVNLANLSNSNTSFGSAQLSLPSGIAFSPAPDSTVSPPTTPVVKLPPGWSASFPSATTMQLTSVKSGSIAPGKAAAIVFTIAAPSSGTFPIGTEVKQSNDFSGTGNDFNATPSSVANLQVVASVQLTWAQQPPVGLDQSIIDPNTGSLKTANYMCPPVSVLVTGLNDTGQPVGPISGISVTVSNGGTGSPTTNPGLYYDYGTSPDYGASPVPLGGGVSVASDSNGLATFGSESSGVCASGFAATNNGSGYTLTASAGGSNSSSDTFAVAQSFQDCPGGTSTTPVTCDSPTITSGTNGTTGTIDASFTADGQLLGSFGEGSLQCDSSVVDLTKVTADPLVAQAFTSPNSSSGTITMTFPKSVVNNLANNGTPLMQVCAGANNPFTTVDGTTTPSCTPDAKLGPCYKDYEGLLPNCPTGYQTVVGINPTDNSILLCVVSRSKKAANETIVIYASDLSDPWSF